MSGIEGGYLLRGRILRTMNWTKLLHDEVRTAITIDSLDVITSDFAQRLLSVQDTASSLPSFALQLIYLQYRQSIRRAGNTRLDIQILNCQKERRSIQSMQLLSQRLEV